MMAIALVEKIFSTTDRKTEEILLQELHEVLLNTKSALRDNTKSSELMLEHYKQVYATLPSEMVTEIGMEPLTECLEFHTDQPISISVFFDFNVNAICQFLGWVFEREYGWTERCQTDSNNSNLSGANSGGSQLKTLCEHFVAWFESHDHLSYYLLLGYRTAIKSSSNSPVVRKQILLSMFRWLRNLSHRCVILPAKCFAVLQDIALLGLTDVWSAIRKDTTSKLGIVLDILMMDQMEELFLSLINISNTGKCTWQEEKTWQSTEGAIRGIYKFLTSCKWVGTSSVSKKVGDLTSAPSVLIKIGKITFPSLPHFIQENLESIVFKLFAHPQLTVRELAGKAFSAFLNKSEHSYFMESFEKVVLHLGKYVNMDGGSLKYMNAYEAEGFMNAVLFLIKNVPLVHILYKWGEYWSIFSHYLIHPASTVRQAASFVFKYLVSKDLSTPSLLTLVLQSLCMGWITDCKSLTSPRKMDVKRLHSTEDLKKRERNGFDATWEWREGRLLAYELIMKFLITNHVYFALSTVTERNPRLEGNKALSTSANEQHTGGVLHGRKSFDSLEKLTGQRRSLTRSLTLSTVSSTELSQSSTRGEKVVESIQGESLITMAQHENGDDGPLLLSCIPALKLTLLPDICLAELIDDQAKQCAAESTMMKWLSHQTFCSFKTLLKQILIHTIECLYEVRWELRRMSQQLLPIVCDVIRHFDNRILENVYSESFSLPDSVLYNGCSQCLLYSIKCYIKAKYPGRNTQNKASERQKLDPEDAEKQISKNFSDLVYTLAENVPKSIHQESLHTSIEILLLYQIHFNREVNNLDKVICEYIGKLYSNSESEGNSPCNENQKCYKDHLDFLSEIQAWLQEYCECTLEKYTVHILPTLLRTICLCKSDSLDVHVILVCAECVLQRLQNCNVGDISELQYVLMNVFNEACCLLQKNDLQIQYTRQTFSILFYLKSILKDNFPLDAVEQIVNSRLENVDRESISGKEDNVEVLGDMNLKKNVRTGDRQLSLSLTYSASSLDTSRLTDDSDSSTEENEDLIENESDWDWSSGEENEKASQGGSALRLLFSNFVNELQGIR